MGMRLEIDIPEHHYNNIMAFDSVNFGRVPYKGIIMYAINAIKHGKVLDKEPTTKNDLGIDLISREKVMQILQEHWLNGTVAHRVIAEIGNDIQHIPSVTPINKECVDAISRKAVLEITAETGALETQRRVKALPPVTPIRPKGHWIEEFNDLEGEVRFTCSSCGKYQLFGTDFCYHCGSDNREV